MVDTSGENDPSVRWPHTLMPERGFTARNSNERGTRPPARNETATATATGQPTETDENNNHDGDIRLLSRCKQ